MQALFNKKPVRIGAIAAGIIAVLALAFFFAPGAGREPAPAPPVTTVAEAALAAAELATRRNITLPPFEQAGLMDAVIETQTQASPATMQIPPSDATTAATSTRALTAASQAAIHTTAVTTRPTTMRTAATTAPRPSYANPNHATTTRIPTTATQATTQTTTTTTSTAQPTQRMLTATLSISCATVLGNEHMRRPNRNPPIPPSGIILAPATVTFAEGTSVLTMLMNEMQARGVQAEQRGGYIRAVNNLYEFDFGEGSGWMYKVNGQFPGFGSGQYILQQGDVVEWVYSLNFGDDVGGSNATG